MSNNPMLDILNQKAQSVAKAQTGKQVKFSSEELNLSLNSFRQQFPNADAQVEKAWLAQRAIAHPTNQNMSFFEDVGTDLSIAFGDRLPQTGGALLGLAGDLIGSEDLANVGWGYAAQQQAEMQESQKEYSPSLVQARANILAAGEKRKAELTADGEMSLGDSVQEFVGTLGDYIQNPRAAASEAVQSSEALLTMAATGGAAGALAKGAVKSAAKKRLGDKMKTQLVEQIANKAAQRAAGATATAYTGVSEGASNALQTRDALNAIPEEVLREAPDFQEYLDEAKGDYETARKEFVKSGAADAFVLSGIAAALIGKATGASDTFGGALLQGGTKGIAKAAATETVEEALQSGSGQVISNIQEQEGDTSKDVLEDVGSVAAAGAVAGGLSGGAIKAAAEVPKAAAKAVGKVVDTGSEAISKKVAEKKAEADAQAETQTTKAYREAKTSTEDVTKKFMEMSPEELTKSVPEVVSTLTALREKQRSPETTPEEAKEIDERINAVKARVKAINEAAVQKAQAEPENLTSAEANQALTGVVMNGKVNTELATKLSGSKHMTSNQKTLLSQLQDSTSVVSKSLKNRQEVNQDIMEGSEDFTGLRDYVELVQTAIANDSQESALMVMNRLRDFSRVQARKAKSGKIGKRQMPPELHALVKDESEAINVVYNALSDTVAKTFPEVAELQEKSMKERAQEMVGKKTTPSAKNSTHTVPQTQRESLVREAYASILDTSKSPEGVDKIRFALRKAGVRTSTIQGVKEAFETIDAAENIPTAERTTETRQELAKAQQTISDTYLTLTDALGTQGLTEALSQYGDSEAVAKVVNSLPQETELNTEAVETALAHVEEPSRTKELTTEADFTKYEALRAAVKEFVETDPSVLESQEGLKQSYIEVSNANLDSFSENTLEMYNQTVELLNALQVPNQEVTTANSETKARSTTPRNRTFQNLIETSPIGSFLRGFLSVNKRIGLLHTENDLIAKLAEKGDYYTHLTRGLSHSDLQDLDRYVRYSEKFAKKLNKTLKGRKEAKANNEEHAKTPLNDHLDDFIRDGSFTPEVSAALASSLANWAGTNGSKSLFNKTPAIAKLLGEPNPDTFRPNAEERKLKDGGIAMSFVAEQIGKHAMQTMGLMPRGTTDENAPKQLSINLGMAAIAAGLADGGAILTRQYVHVIRDSSGKTVKVEISDSSKKPKLKEGQTHQSIPTLQATPNKVQVEGEPTRLNSAMEDAIAGAMNDNLMRDFLGAEPVFKKMFLDGEVMPEHKVEQGLAQVQADALNKNQEIKYQLDEGLWDLMNQLDPEYKQALVDGIPPAGTEHMNNTDRNENIREDIAREFEDVATMIQQLKDSGSKFARFAMQASKKNKRMMQQGTLGNPQNSKLVRHLFKMANNVLTIDPKDKDMLLSYQMAVMEALDEDGSGGRGVDKSEDGEVVQGFNEYITKPEVQKAIKAMQAETKSRADIEVIQEFIGLPQVKRGSGTSGTAARLDGLIALAQYKKDEPFEVNLFKENDGITNGIAIALLQLAGADSFDNYVERLARVGIYVDSDVKAFGTFAKEGRKDSYVSFGDVMTRVMQNPEENPASRNNILPELDLRNNISGMFFDKATRSAAQNNYIPVTDSEGRTTQQKQLEKNKLKISREDYNRSSGAMAFFLGKGFKDKETGTFKKVNDYVEEVIRDFAKNPLMIANYGASMVGLKKSVANNIVGAVELALEELNQYEGEAKESAIKTLEQAVNGMSIVPHEVVTEWKDGKPVKKEPWVFKVNRENPLETVVDQNVYQVAAIGVELTYGPAMEKAFDEEYGQQRRDVDQIIQATRMATFVYDEVLEKTRKAKMEEMGRNYLTVEEAAAIKEELKPYAPYIATAMSDDRFNDGIYIPKGEKTKDREDGEYINEATDKVKVTLNFGDAKSAESHTFSDKVQDPSVSAAAILVQSLDATTQTLSMLQTDLVNVHDASIFSLADSFKGTEAQNQGFVEALTKYSMFDAVRETLDSVMSHELVDADMKALIEKGMAKEIQTHTGPEGTLQDFLDQMTKTSDRINKNRNLMLKHSRVNVNQYSAGDNSAYSLVPSEAMDTESKENAWVPVGGLQETGYGIAKFNAKAGRWEKSSDTLPESVGEQVRLEDGRIMAHNPETGVYEEVTDEQLLEPAYFSEPELDLIDEEDLEARIAQVAAEREQNATQRVEERIKAKEAEANISVVDQYKPRKPEYQQLRARLKHFLRQGMSIDEALVQLEKRGAGQAKAPYAEFLPGFKKAIRGKLNQTSKVISGSAGNARSKRAQEAAAELEINQSTLRPIFEQLAGKGAVKDSKEHSAHLSQMIDLLEPTVQAVRLAIFKENEEASGAVTDSGIELTINTGAKASGIEMSTQEVLVHEMMHTLLQGADKNSRAYREIRKMYAQARKELKPEDFLGDIENPTAQDLKDAKARYDHTIHNRVEGGRKYQTYLGEQGQWFNADPVEEFAVMALTNQNLRQALRNKELRMKEKPEGIVNRLKALFEWLLNQFGADLSRKGVSADKHIVRLAEHLQGSLNQKKSMVYRATSILDTPLDAASAWMKDVIGTQADNFTQTYELLKDTTVGMTAREKASEYKKAALNTAFAKNSLTVAMYNEFTSGRRSLSDLARLISKSSMLVERNPQFFTESITRELGEVFTDITEEQSVQLYRLLETDIQSLMNQYSPKDVLEFATDSHKRKVRISKLAGELRKVAPSAARYMTTHARDLGYHMVTGERLIVDGKYTNAYQIANMWGFTGSKGKIAPKQAEAIVDEMATLYAIEYSAQDQSIKELFTQYTEDDLATLLTYHLEVVDAAMGTTFKDNEYNYRKGYLKEEFENQVDITVAPISEEPRLLALGYQRGEPVLGDPLVQGPKQYYYVKENGSMAKYLTGALSTAAPAKRGTDLFQVSASDSELNKMRLSLSQDKLTADKQRESRKVFAGTGTFLKAHQRGNVAQPIFDSQGNVTGYRYVASHRTKNKIHGRKMDFARGLGATYGGIVRRIGAKNVNHELMDYFHQQFTDEYHKNPDLFINLAKAPEYRDQYNLIPPETKQYAKGLFGSGDIWVPRTQVDIAIGYRKFSVSQLQWDKDPKATALREILRYANNTAAVMFNNQVGMSIETYWQAFVATAKDTLVIKSGMVTAANIASNLTLLWFSGVNPVQASKDHAEAYKATWQYLQDKEEEFRAGLELKRPGLTEEQRKEIESRRAVLRQDMLTNPVRELMEAGMYSAIVDDVDVGEHTAVTKDWFDKKIEPIAKRTPEAVKTVAKNFMLTHDTKVYKVMRDMAQISDFAARYSLHKHNLSKGMKKEESFNDIRTTFVDYDMPSHKAVQYANDMGLLGFTKYFFRIQQVILKNFAERPARLMGFALMNSLLGLGIASPTDALFGFDGLAHRMYSPDDWMDFATQTAPMNLLVH